MGEERIEIEKERRERDKRELRRQFEGEEGGPKRNKIFTWRSNIRKSQVHFMMKSLI